MARAVGEEAMKEGILEIVEDESWVKAEYSLNGNLLIRSLQVITFHLSFPRFIQTILKVRSRLGVGAGRSVGDELPPLPLNKTVVEVFEDFFNLPAIFKILDFRIRTGGRAYNVVRCVELRYWGGLLTTRELR